MGEVETLKKLLREKGLTEEQVEAGVRYYLNFASKFDIPPARAANMVVKMVEEMRKFYEKIS